MGWQKNYKPLLHPSGMANVNGNYYQSLTNPQTYLSKVSGGNAATISVQLIRNLTIQSNANGCCAFIWQPQAVNDASANSSGVSPLLWQFEAGYNGQTALTAVGYTAIDVGSILNVNSFSAARVVSGYIELIPNLSITNASGKGYIAAGVITPATTVYNPGSTTTTTYANLQRQDNISANRMFSEASLVKMEGLAATWIPNENSDVLDFPRINFTVAGDLLNRHPEQRVIYGQFVGMPAATTIGVKIITNLELLPGNDLATAGLFPLISECSKENEEPIHILSRASKALGNLTKKVYFGKP
nr:hypothetical protein [Tolivirales sp.]